MFRIFEIKLSLVMSVVLLVVSIAGCQSVDSLLTPSPTSLADVTATPLSPSLFPTEVITPTAVVEATATNTATQTLKSTDTNTLIPGLYVFSQGFRADTYIIKGNKISEYNISDDLVVYGEVTPGTEVVAALLKVVARNPDSLSAQIILIHPNFSVLSTLRVDSNLDYVSASDLIPFPEFALGYLLRPEVIRLRPNSGIQKGSTLQALHFESVGATQLDALPFAPAIIMRVTGIGTEGNVASVELIEGNWPLTGTIVSSVILEPTPLPATATSLPTSLPTPPLGPTATPNAYGIDTLTLVSEGRIILQQNIVNLDNQGPDEIVLSSVISNTIEYELAVFAYIKEKGWTQIMRLTQALENSCAFYTGKYGLVRVTSNETVQVIPWSQCGTGALLEFEVYEYQGLGFMNRIYQSSPDNPSQRDLKWMGAMPIFDDNYHFYVSHNDGIYQYRWENNTLVGYKEDVDPGSSGVTVEYWLDSETNTIRSSLPEIHIQVGSYLHLKQREDSGLQAIGDVRIQIVGDNILTWVNGTLLYAERSGACTIQIRGWEQSPIVVVSVTESDTPGAP